MVVIFSYVLELVWGFNDTWENDQCDKLTLINVNLCRNVIMSDKHFLFITF